MSVLPQCTCCDGGLQTNVPPVGRETRRSEMHRHFAHPALSYATLHVQTHRVVLYCTLPLNARACGMKITVVLIALSIVSTAAQSVAIPLNPTWCQQQPYFRASAPCHDRLVNEKGSV